MIRTTEELENPHDIYTDEEFEILFQTGNIVYENGEKDNWAVMVRDSRESPWIGVLDSQMMDNILQAVKKYSRQAIWQNMKVIYNLAEVNPKDEDLTLIRDNIADKRYRFTLYVYYYGMIAENNKKTPDGLYRLPMKKRLKMLGLHQLLYEGYTVEEASNFSRGKKSKELIQLCNERGIYLPRMMI